MLVYCANAPHVRNKHFYSTVFLLAVCLLRTIDPSVLKSTRCQLRSVLMKDLSLSSIGQVVLMAEAESPPPALLSLCRRRLSVGGACAADDRSHMAPLSVRHNWFESDTGPGPQGRASSGVEAGSGVKALVWAPGCC